MKIRRKAAAIVLASPVCMIAFQIVANKLAGLPAEKSTSRLQHDQHQNEGNYTPLISSFYQLTKNDADATTYNSPKTEDDEKDAPHYHEYPIFIVMYHKTGYVLTRQLKNLVNLMEVEAQRPLEMNTYYKRSKYSNSGIDINTGERFAFDGVGGWTRSAFAPRQHYPETGCPKGYQKKPFQMHKGTIYLQESPDIFCHPRQLERAILAGRIKIIHFVRNPFDMALSNYLYHSQDPTPEKWVHVDDPCHVMYDRRGEETVASNVLPSIGTDEVDEEYFHNIVKMCKSLFQSSPSMKNSTFYEHLRQLDSWDGLRLSTAQMIAASGYANKHLAGGDVLRMANNIVKFKELQRSNVTDVKVLTLSTEHFINNTLNSTIKFFDFIFGSDNTIISRERKWEAARSQHESFDRVAKRSSAHITQNTTFQEKKSREKLKELLRSDKILAPILELTESLVNKALTESENV